MAVQLKNDNTAHYIHELFEKVRGIEKRVSILEEQTANIHDSILAWNKTEKTIEDLQFETNSMFETVFDRINDIYDDFEELDAYVDSIASES